VETDRVENAPFIPLNVRNVKLYLVSAALISIDSVPGGGASHRHFSASTPRSWDRAEMRARKRWKSLGHWGHLKA
jgi:hypothetical protein